MTGRTVCLVATMLVLGRAGGLETRGGRQEPVFRARTDAVVVSVAVRARNRPVAGLAAADFRLLDNGVPQEITSTSAETAPVDVTLVLDTSASVSGAEFDRLKADIQRMAELLKADDRLRLLTFSYRVTDVMGLQAGNARLPLDRLKAGGNTAFHNALGAALTLSPGADRPHLVFSVTDGFDNASFLTPRDLVDLAGDSSAALYIALLPSRVFTVVPGSGGSNMGPLQGGRFGGEVAAQAPMRVPVEVPHQQTLRDAAAVTGGAFYAATATDTLPGLFHRVLDDFRTNYILRYAPRGVERGGWHEITVTVPSRSGATVRTRRGYEGS